MLIAKTNTNLTRISRKIKNLQTGKLYPCKGVWSLFLSLGLPAKADKERTKVNSYTSQRSRVSINSGLEQVRFQVERKQSKVENFAAQPSTGAGYSYQRFNNTSINL